MKLAVTATLTKSLKRFCHLSERSKKSLKYPCGQGRVLKRRFTCKSLITYRQCVVALEALNSRVASFATVRSATERTLPNNRRALSPRSVAQKLRYQAMWWGPIASHEARATPHNRHGTAARRPQRRPQRRGVRSGVGDAERRWPLAGRERLRGGAARREAMRGAEWRGSAMSAGIHTEGSWPDGRMNGRLQYHTLARGDSPFTKTRSAGARLRQDFTLSFFWVAFSTF